MVVEIKVIPRSAKNEVVVVDGKLIVKVTSPPEGGKANAAALRTLAKWLRVGASEISLLVGKSSRNKVVSLPDEIEPVLVAKLGAVASTGGNPRIGERDL